ncbi:MAG: hypothetical protein ACOCZV_01270 [Nanoarchaeota archaeon]
MRQLQKTILDSINDNPTVLFPEESLQQIFMTIYLAEEPISIRDIARTTGLSLASVSTKAKELLKYRVITKHTEPQNRQLFLKTSCSLIDVMRMHSTIKTETMEHKKEELHQLKKNEKVCAEEKKKINRIVKELNIIIKANKQFTEQLGKQKAR